MIFFFVSRADGSVSSIISADDADSHLYLGSAEYVATPPPPCAPGYSPQWSGESWSCAIDKRGSQWHQPGTQNTLVITLLGQLPPPGWVAGAPPADQGETLEL